MAETARRKGLPWLLFLLLVAVGLWAAGYLAFLHVKAHTDPAYRSFCSVSAEMDCVSVAESPWAVFLGLPVATWGLFGYGLLGALALSGLRRRKPHESWPVGLLFLFSGVALLVGVVLAGISMFAVRSGCLVCMVSWAVSAGLFAIAWYELRRSGLSAVAAIRKDALALAASSGLSAAFVGVPLALVGALLLLYPHYWKTPVRQGPGGLATGVTEDGSPWIGSTDPTVTLELFTDYECPHCAKENFAFRETLERHPRLRLVFRHFPLDGACNPVIKGQFHRQACRLALATTCAGEQGQFWELSDAVFRHTGKAEVDLRALARETGVDEVKLQACMAGERAKQKLAADVQAGIRHNIQGTPALVYEGRMYEGGIPPALLAKILEKAK